MIFDYASQPKELVPRCPVCRYPNPSEPSRDRNGFAIQIARCRCGVEYLAERMTREGYAKFYTEAYRPLAWAVANEGAYDHAQMQRDLLVDQQHYAAKWIAQWRRLIPASERLLDVGGSTGVMARTILDACGCRDALVLDPSAEELAEARAQGLETYQGFAEDAPDLGLFDGIVCCQALDHVAEPLHALQWMRASVTPKGWLYVDIVDALLWARHTRRTQIVHKVDHLVQWSPWALQDALKATGWKGIRETTRSPKETSYGVWCVPA